MINFCAFFLYLFPYFTYHLSAHWWFSRGLRPPLWEPLPHVWEKTNRERKRRRCSRFEPKHGQEVFSQNLICPEWHHSGFLPGLDHVIQLWTSSQQLSLDEESLAEAEGAPLGKHRANNFLTVVSEAPLPPCGGVLPRHAHLPGQEPHPPAHRGPGVEDPKPSAAGVWLHRGGPRQGPSPHVAWPHACWGSCRRGSAQACVRARGAGKDGGEAQLPASLVLPLREQTSTGLGHRVRVWLKVRATCCSLSHTQMFRNHITATSSVLFSDKSRHKRVV